MNIPSGRLFSMNGCCADGLVGLLGPQSQIVDRRFIKEEWFRLWLQKRPPLCPYLVERIALGLVKDGPHKGERMTVLQRSQRHKSLGYRSPASRPFASTRAEFRSSRIYKNRFRMSSRVSWNAEGKRNPWESHSLSKPLINGWRWNRKAQSPCERPGNQPRRNGIPDIPPSRVESKACAILQSSVTRSDVDSCPSPPQHCCEWMDSGRRRGDKTDVFIFIFTRPIKYQRTDPASVFGFPPPAYYPNIDGQKPYHVHHISTCESVIRPINPWLKREPALLDRPIVVQWENFDQLSLRFWPHNPKR